MSIAPDFLKETKMAKKPKKDAGMTAKQKKLPPALQKAIMKKKAAK